MISLYDVLTISDISLVLSEKLFKIKISIYLFIFLNKYLKAFKNRTPLKNKLFSHPKHSNMLHSPQPVI